jgi:hypothetical protein
MTQLAQGPDADRARGTFRDQQCAQCFDGPGAALGVAARTARPRCPRRFDRVELVGLAVATSFLPVGTIDLDYGHTRRGEVASQPGAVGAGAFHPDPLERTERAEPTRQRVISLRRRRERLHAQHGAVRIDRGCDMHLQVRIDTPDNRARGIYDGHLPSLLSLNWARGGTHVPGRRP